MSNNYLPDDTVMTCPYIEGGLSFDYNGAYACNANTAMSPKLFSVTEIQSGLVTHESIQEKRRKLFHYLNTGDKRAGDCLTCSAVYKTSYKNVSFDSLGGTGVYLCTRNFTKCNLRCKYCVLAQENSMVPPQYSTDAMLQAFQEFADKDKVIGRPWFAINGGEPSIIKGYMDFCDAVRKIGDVCVFSNCVKYDAKAAELLRDDKIFITVSLDAGTPTTFAEVRGAPAMWKVADTLVRYRKTGTHRLWLKYIITEDNCNEDDLFGFVFFMTALRPDKVYICPEFPYGDRETPYKFVTFGARMWYLLKKYADMSIHIQTDDNTADPKFKKYSDAIRKEFAKLNQSKALDDTYTLIESDKKISSRINSALREAQNRIIARFKNAKRERERESYFYNIYEKITEKIGSFLFPQKYMQQYIRNSLLFDNEFYQSQLDSGMCNDAVDGIAHYCRVGWKEGKNPNNWFDTNAYLKAHPDVTINPFFHYLRYGILEGRSLQ